jgi:hypothetical protein
MKALHISSVKMIDYYNDIEEEKILRRIPLEILALSFVIALASLLFFSPLTAVFVLGGGAFSALSFVWLKQEISKLFLLKNGKSPSHAASSALSKEKEQSPFLKNEAVPFLQSPSLKKALLSGLALYALRLLLILAVFFIIILLFSKKIIAFAVGFSVIIPVFLAEAVIALSRMKQWKG